MLSIYIQPQSLQIVSAEFHKKKLIISQAEKIKFPSRLENGLSQDQVAERFQDIFYYLKDYIDEAIHIVLPDYLFTLVDCFKFNNDDEIPSLISKAVGKKADQLYWSKPLFIQPAPQEKIVSVYTIEKTFIDGIIDAAESESIKILSVEPASICFLRCVDTLNKEIFIFEGYQEQATFLGYSDIAGIFKMEVPEIALAKLSDTTDEKFNADIQNALITFESVADSTFEYMDQNIPISLLGLSKYQSFEAFQKRKPQKKYLFPEFIEADINEPDENWLIPVGTFLQNLSFDADDGRFVNYMSSDISINSANLLPSEIVRNAKRFQIWKKTEKYSLYLCGFLIMLIISEVAALLFFTSVSIPQALQEEYHTKQQSIKGMNQELEIIQLYEKEHERPLEALTNLVKNKPEMLYFTDFQVHSVPPAVQLPQQKKDGSKDKGNAAKPLPPAPVKWITLKMVSNNPIVFQDYLMILSKDDFFRNVMITEINSDSSGYKTAAFSIGKGDVKN